MSAPTDKAVIAAVYDNDSVALQHLLQGGANPNAQDEDGYSAAIIAANSDRIPLLRLLIAFGADLNRQDARGYTALNHAIERNHLVLLPLLLEAGADPDTQNGAEFTALMGAALCNRVEAVRVLLEGGANVNARNNKGVSALFSAALHNHIEVVRVLLDAGATPTTEEIIALGEALRENEVTFEIHQLIREALQNRLDVILEEMRANAAVRSPRELMSSDTADNPEIVQLPTFAEQQQEPTGNSMSRTDMYDFLLRRDGAKCQGCGRAFDDPRYLEIDHIMPRSDGGSDHISNRVLLCGPCNRAKGNQYTLSGLRRLNKKNGWMVEP